MLNKLNLLFPCTSYVAKSIEFYILQINSNPVFENNKLANQ